MAPELSSGVSSVVSTYYGAFAALKTDGSVVVWGSDYYGGDSSAAAVDLTSNVVALYANTKAFAALKSDGSVVSWGKSSEGGDSSAVADDLNAGVSEIYATNYAFAALKNDGTIISWGLVPYNLKMIHGDDDGDGIDNFFDRSK